MYIKHILSVIVILILFSIFFSGIGVNITGSAFGIPGVYIVLGILLLLILVY